MKLILELFLVTFLRIALWFRYRIKVKGLENLNPQTLKRPGGVLFLPNHPTVFVDATVVSIVLWPKYRLRPMVIDYMYNLPIVNFVMRLIDALPVPNFEASSNSLKRKKNEKITQAVIDGLRNKEHFLIFPSGGTKKSAHEALNGASAAHRIMQEAPEANIALVRVKGLWGSSFSRAFTGKSPPFFGTVLNGVKWALKNGLFFMPRRELIVEFQPAPEELYQLKNRLDFNRYLEHWFDRADGLQPQTGEYPGDSLVLVPYAWWQKKEDLQLWKPEDSKEAIDIGHVPLDIQKKIINKVVELTGSTPEAIAPNMTLTTDLGMDSLDVAELIAFLQDQFDIVGVASKDLTTVGKLMAIAAKQVVCEDSHEEEEHDLSLWRQPAPHQKVQLAQGNIIPEVFLNNCARMGNAVACADMRSGIVTYNQMKLRTIILAEYIRNLPGKYVGILLPASTAASMTILACQLAGKVPLMINWTVGPRHLQAVAELSKVQAVLTSGAFIDKLQNVDLTGIDDMLIMLEDVKQQIGLTTKLKSYLLSKKSPASILKALKLDKVTKEQEAVLLFTSGTESMPKGVPLTHQNILSNQRAAVKAIDIFSDDILFGILPPFHSFGFTISSLISFLTGFKVAFSPDPTDSRQLVKGLERWKITIICGAPTFIKGIIKAAKPEQLNTMRLCVSGAEKMPPDLEMALKQLGKADCLLEGYGITECSPVLTFTQQGNQRRGVGQALPGVELCVVDLNTHSPLATGQQGLILARGPNIFSGYLNPGLASPFITVQSLQWYVTGDLGYLDPNGNLILSGRLKRFIKVGGEMVGLASIEEAVTKIALQKGWINGKEEGPTLAVCAKELNGDRPKIVLFCTFATTVDDVNKALKDSGFSNLIRITAVEQLPELPVMGTGKIHYRKLEELLQSNGAGDVVKC